MPRASANRPKGFLARSPDAPGPSLSRVQASSEQRAVLRTPAERFVAFFVLLRGSHDMRFVSVFTVFCWVRTKFAPNVHERRQIAKTETFCPPTSMPGASVGAKIEPQRPRSSEKTRPKCPRGLRKIFSQRERANFERDGASSAPEERAEPRRTRAVIAESSNG